MCSSDLAVQSFFVKRNPLLLSGEAHRNQEDARAARRDGVGHGRVLDVEVPVPRARDDQSGTAHREGLRAGRGRVPPGAQKVYGPLLDRRDAAELLDKIDPRHPFLISMPSCGATPPPSAA